MPQYSDYWETRTADATRTRSDDFYGEECTIVSANFTSHFFGRTLRSGGRQQGAQYVATAQTAMECYVEWLASRVQGTDWKKCGLMWSRAATIAYYVLVVWAFLFVVNIAR